MTHRSRHAVNLGLNDYLTSMHKPQWEYLRMRDPSGSHLETLGRDGWELVNVTGGDVAWYVFKRRVE
jgi:hypothetical protein